MIGRKPLTIDNVYSEDCLCGVCKGYLSIPPVVYCASMKEYVCGRCYDDELYSDDIIIQQTNFEKQASGFLFPCSNEGCRWTVEFGDDAKHHEQICEFAEIKCPISNFFRGFLKPTETPCFFSCAEEAIMIEHVKQNHSDYILPAPFMIRSLDIKLDFELRRMYIIIFLEECMYKMAVLTTEKDSNKLKLRCRTITDCPMVPEYCVLDINPPLNDKIQCFTCVSLERPRYEKEQEEEVFVIKLCHFQQERIIRFSIEDTEESFLKDEEDIIIDAIKSLSMR